MTLVIEPVPYSGKSVMRRMLELYLYDFSEFTHDDLDEHGEFGYRYLDHYWATNPDDERFPFFIRVGGKICGFALVRLKGGRYSMAEFFVMRAYRRGGIGSQAARAVFDRFPGDWDVWQLASNLAAQAFWRKVVGDFSGGAFTELSDAQGVGQAFRSP